MVHFSTRDHYSKIIPLPKNTLTEKIISNVAAGVLAGASLHSVVYSLDYTRTRLANDIKKVHKIFHLLYFHYEIY